MADVLQWFVVGSSLMVLSLCCLVPLFLLLLYVKMNESKESKRQARGWFGGPGGRVQQQQPVYVPATNQRRGWFSRN